MQYPDTISFQNGGTNAVYDQNSGLWTPGTSGTATEVNCRYEASNGNGYISAVDGERINFSGIVYMPKGSPIIKTGIEVTITEKREGQADNVFTEKVLRFHAGQMNARLWV
jgi:hypothetical protein